MTSAMSAFMQNTPPLPSSCGLVAHHTLVAAPRSALENPSVPVPNAHLHGTRPQTLSYALTDSPIGLSSVDRVEVP